MNNMFFVLALSLCVSNILHASSFDEGLRLMNEKKYPEAVTVLEGEARSNPGSSEVLLNLGWAYWHAKRIDDAWKIGATLVKLDPDNRTFLVFLANTDIEKKDYNSAVALSQKVLKQSPEDRDASMILSRALFRLDRKTEAMRVLDKIIQADPHYEDAIFRKAEFLSEMGQSNEAINYLNKLIASNPSNPLYRRARAKVLYDIGHYREAETQWKSLTRNQQPDAESLLNLGYAYWKEKNYDEAMKIGNILLKLDDSNPTFLRFVANTEIERLNYTEALRLAEKALKVSPGDRDASIVLATALFRLQRIQEGMLVLDNLIKEYPDNPSVEFHWAEFMSRMGHYNEAIETFRRLLKLDPSSAAYRLNLAETLYISGRFSEAISEWKILALADPPNPIALRQLRDDAFNRRAWDEAEKWQAKILALNPSDHAAWEKMAAIYTGKKSYSRAYTAISTAIAADPVSITGYYLMAEALEQLQLWDAAQQFYEEILRRNPNSLRAQDGLSHILEAKGDYPAAIKALHQVQLMEYPWVSPYRLVQEARLWADYGNIRHARGILRKLSSSRRVLIPVLLYHGVSKYNRFDSIQQDNLRKQLEEFKRRGYNPITVSELDEVFQGRGALPEKPLMVTFDDGRIDTFQNADPILRELHWKATMFVHLSQLRKPGFHASPDEIRKWYATGRWDMQAHGYQAHDPTPIDKEGRIGHFLPNRMWLESENRMETTEEFRVRVEREYVRAKQSLEDILPGHKVVAFAYPYGDYGQNDYTNTPQAAAINQALVKKYFHLAFIQDPNGVNDLSSNPTSIVRFTVPKFMSPRELAGHIASGDPWVQAKLLEAGLWTRSDQLGRAQGIYKEIKEAGFDEPQLWAETGLADEKAGDLYDAEKQFSSAIEPGVDSASNTLYHRLLSQAKSNGGPVISAEAQEFSDSHSNEIFKGIARAGASIKSLRLQVFGGEGYYFNRQLTPASVLAPRVNVREAGLEAGIFLGPEGRLDGSFERRTFSKGTTGFIDNYTVNGSYQLASWLKAAARDGAGNVETEPAILEKRQFHTDGGGVVLDPLMNWRITGDYDDFRYNDTNREQDIHAQLIRMLTDAISVSAAFLHGDSRREQLEYYTPKGLNQYTGILTIHPLVGKKSKRTGLQRLDLTLQYEGGYAFQGVNSQVVNAGHAGLVFRLSDYLALTLDGKYQQSPTYLSRRGDVGLALTIP